MIKKTPLPTLVLHCDWGGKAQKRWMATAIHDGGQYTASKSTTAGVTATFFDRVRRGLDDHQRALVGFDFPIGLPLAYAREASIEEFLPALLSFGKGDWTDFYDKGQKPTDISIYRPFFPRSCPKKGDATRQHLTKGLGLEWQDLLRKCEKATDTRGDACPLFWTLGGNQVGTASISGWQEIIAPALNCENQSVGVWPFHGDLVDLLESRRTIITETYPGEVYNHLGFPSQWKGKRNQAKRRERSVDLLSWAKSRNVACDEALVSEIKDGFGTGADGEDRFDAVVGLFGMLDVVLGFRTDGVPESEEIRRIEGWIFGQQVAP